MLESAARTVRDVAAHFAQMRVKVEAMLQAFGASERGYFTPAQDEQVRQLLVSYWQARLAMLDLIDQLRLLEPQLDDDDRLAGFIIAYAAAVVLVDAARFVRASFKNRPIVIAKLNEPEPYFGIPAGVYDTVMKSLTDPVNAWHLYQANESFAEHRDALASRACEDALLEALMAIIKQRGDCVRVSPAAYARARVAVRGRELAERLGRLPLSRLLYRLQTFGGSVVADIHTLPRHQPRLPAPVKKKLLALAEPGDVFIVRKEYAVTNYFLPGFWPHAALYLGEIGEMQAMGIHELEQVRPRWRRICDAAGPEEHRVLESMKDGVLVRSVNSPLGCDAIAVIRPRLDRALIPAALARGLFHEGKAYDFDFDFTRSDRLVCTEVIYRTYEGMGDMCLELSSRVGRLTLAAEDMLRLAAAGKCFDIVAVYAPGYRKRLQTGNDAHAALQSTL